MVGVGMEPVLFLLFALLVLLEALPVARPAAAAVLRGGAGAFAVFTLAADEFDFGASGVVDPAAAAASAPFDVDRLGVAAGDDRECDTLECEFVVADEPFSVGVRAVPLLDDWLIPFDERLSAGTVSPSSRMCNSADFCWLPLPGLVSADSSIV